MMEPEERALGTVNEIVAANTSSSIWIQTKLHCQLYVICQLNTSFLSKGAQEICARI